MCVNESLYCTAEIYTTLNELYFNLKINFKVIKNPNLSSQLNMPLLTGCPVASCSPALNVIFPPVKQPGRTRSFQMFRLRSYSCPAPHPSLLLHPCCHT